MTCLKCGGSMIGDGYTSVMRCEYAEEYEFHAPDANPVYCTWDNDFYGDSRDLPTTTPLP